MLKIDWKARLTNKTFWVTTISLVVLLSQQIGFNLSAVIPSNYVDIVNTIFALLGVLGVVVDTSTPGIGDKEDDTDTDTDT